MKPVKYAAGEMEKRVGGMKVNSAIFSAIREGSTGFADDRTFELAVLLEQLVGLGRKQEIPRDKAIAVCERIDELHQGGAPWPRWSELVGRRMAGAPFTVRANFVREPSLAPLVPYCVRWMGAYWAPCWTTRERRESQYVPLEMCWAGVKPKPGSYMVSGARARFAYRVIEVENFKPPRTAKKYTCRLWCWRVPTELLRSSDDVHAFYWHPRKRKKTAAPVRGRRS